MAFCLKENNDSLALTDKQIARLAGCSTQEADHLLRELVSIFD